MFAKKIPLLFALAATLAWADDASHRKVAGELIELTSGAESIRAGFNLGLQPMLDGLRQRGAPEAAIAETKAALNDWLEKEIVWTEIKPGLVDLYVREFTEAELNDVLAFYRTPTGRKTITKLPTLLTEAARISQSYAATKQASLITRMQAIAQKYNLK